MKHPPLDVKLIEPSDLQDFLLSALERANHHARHIEKVLYPLAGAVIMMHDREEGLWVRGMGGDRNWSGPGKVLSFSINGRPHTLTYHFPKKDATTKAIVLRDGSRQGPIRAAFTNRTSVDEIYAVFSALKAA